MPSAPSRSRSETETNRTLSFVLTCLGGVALALVVIGIIIIARSIARPLAAITATIKQVADGAENVVVPHSGRADEIGALARAIEVFQDAMGRNRNLASQVSQDSAAREQRARHIEQSVEAFREAIGAIMRGLSDNASVMRETAQTITRVTADASSRAGTAANATEQASHNVTAVAGAAEELSASVEEIGRQVRAVRKRGRADRPAHRKIDRRDREPRRRHAAHRRRADPDSDHRRADQSARAQRHHRGRACRRCRPRLCRRRARSEGAGGPDREGDRRHQRRTSR